MEFDNGFMQRSSRKCGQLILERTESFRYSVKIILVFDFLQTDSILDKAVSSPCAAIAVSIERFSIFGRNNVQRLTLRVAAILQNDLAQEAGNVADVFHQFFRVLECVSIDALHNVALAFVACPNDKCIIDMAFAIARNFTRCTVEGKCISCFFQDAFCDSVHCFSSHRFIG